MCQNKYIVLVPDEDPVHSEHSSVLAPVSGPETPVSGLEASEAEPRPRAARLEEVHSPNLRS